MTSDSDVWIKFHTQLPCRFQIAIMNDAIIVYMALPGVSVELQSIGDMKHEGKFFTMEDH